MVLRDRLAEDPADPEALTLLAEIAAQERRVEEATVLLRAAVAADPDPERRVALIVHLQKNASPALALREIEELPDAIRGTFDFGNIEAKTLGLLGKHDEQIRIYERMLRQKPTKAGIWMNLANALKTVGKSAEAVQALKQTLRLQPTSGHAYWALANFKSYKFSPREITQMLQALRSRPSHDEALHIHFALGKAYEDAGQYESSFRHYAAANELRAREVDPTQASIRVIVDDLIENCTPEVFVRADGGGHSAADPIFIVGLHRSGSTLIEQILASHPEVEGTAELTAMNAITSRLRRTSGRTLGQLVAGLDRSELADIGKEYLERTRSFRQTDRPRFVDKMPGNWVNVPLIRLALPNAKIIDARRHPMACGFSNYKQNYATGVAFSYSLRSIGQFYLDYWRFMQRFDELQPAALHRVVNERLIEDPEGEVRQLLSYLDLPFSDSCLEFHTNNRAVRTPSAEQVRRPINRDGTDYWRHYEPWLGELKEALGPALSEWDS